MHDIRLQELRLYTDYGRCCRPLFIVQDQQLTIKKSHIEKLQQREISGYHWQNLIQDGLLECGPPPLLAPLVPANCDCSCVSSTCAACICSGSAVRHPASRCCRSA